ncbi:Lar family restriction alleviation protein [Burkholderia gladioli]|uniref:Lar family restriction alleviation protein n=1 Tax=Burkholderia gladioli TaxID=28095 RepID=UPI001641B047|nr:Lar family restriction alleviation protein [Burkholderia gladioli]
MSDKLTHLLPCPFCGCTKVPKRQGNGIGDYWLECFDCGASTRLREDGAGMEKDWNRRASPAPAIPMPALNDAMRAVLTNENCVYGTPEELYAALVKAAPAIPADDPVGVPRALLASLVDDVEEYAGRHSFREREQEVRAREIARARVILAAPAISESEDTKLLDFIAAESVDLVSFAIPYEDDADIGWRVLQHHIGEAEPRVIGEVFKDDPRAAIRAARKGEKS